MKKWTDISIGLVSGGVSGGFGVLLLWLVKNRDIVFLKWPGVFFCVLGLAFVAAGFMRASAMQRALRTGAILFLNTAVLVCIVEGFCRVAGVNLAGITGEQKRFERYPVCFRMPTQPVPEVYFTRPGPQVWTGRVLNTLLKNLNATDNPYPDEPEITAHYDKNGFRNPDDLTDWDIAVAGDSFTEAGYLPEEQMFTSILAAKSGKRVKHLGVSYTGNFTQTAYLENFGKAPSTKQAVIAFFEGNDIDDDAREYRDLQNFRTTGQRPYREVGRETSLFKTFYLFVKNLRHFSLQPRSYATASWVFDGKKTPVSIYYAPPAPESLSKTENEALRAALDGWAKVNRDLGIEPWLLYLPYKRRVLHGALEFKADADPEIVNWEPNGLPEFIERLCKQRGIKFIDSTAALVESCKKGMLTHNTIYDTHLNREGNRIVGELLAKTLTAAP